MSRGVKATCLSYFCPVQRAVLHRWGNAAGCCVGSISLQGSFKHGSFGGQVTNPAASLSLHNTVPKTRTTNSIWPRGVTGWRTGPSTRVSRRPTACCGKCESRLAASLDTWTETRFINSGASHPAFRQALQKPQLSTYRQLRMVGTRHAVGGGTVVGSA